ncbi:hypothetical protein [Paracoccus zhejiangensis]|uniref:hypothetical protein n=1 Tax=Paracoccus zhejiangensis TaxID=1077935 RepID=UPI0012FFDD88|nr:hypothetical protein [Paracoccus zhejiangensis]
MRFLLSGLLVLLLAINMTLVPSGTESAGQQLTTATMGPGVVQTTHECCPESQKPRHGACAMCVAVHPAGAMPLDACLPRKVEHFPSQWLAETTELGLPLRPPQCASA